MVRHLFVSFFLSFFAFLIMLFLYVALPQFLIGRLAPNSLPPFVAHPTPRPTATPSSTPSPTPDLTPVTLIIPKLDIQAVIEPVGFTASQNMDVPKNAANAAWYQYGPMPSKEGNAVIAAHYDTPTGRPALFYNLRTLIPGDEVTVISQNAVRSDFVVVERATIPYDTFPSEHVFKTRAGKNLNLITCGGIWDPVKRVYSNRIVVYTTLKESAAPL